MARRLDEGTAALVALSAAIASHDAAELAAAVDRAAGAGEPAAAEEVLLQSMLFLGFPAAISAFEVWRRRTGAGAGSGTVQDAGAGSGAGADPARVAGEAVCRRIYGDRYGALRERMRSLHPDLDRWIVEHGYGEVLARPALSLRRRELCAVAALARAGKWPKQLSAHLRGALNAGASPAEVEGALALALERAPEEAVRVAWTAWRQVRRAHRVAEPTSSATEPGRAPGASGGTREDGNR